MQPSKRGGAWIAWESAERAGGNFLLNPQEVCAKQTACENSFCSHNHTWARGMTKLGSDVPSEQPVIQAFSCTPCSVIDTRLLIESEGNR